MLPLTIILSDPVWIGIIAFCGAVFGAGFLLGVITLIRFRRRDNAITIKEETVAFSSLREDAENQIKKLAEQEREKSRLYSENETNKHLLAIKDGMVKEFFENLRLVTIEQGRAIQREKDALKVIEQKNKQIEEYQTQLFERNNQYDELQIKFDKLEKEFKELKKRFDDSELPDNKNK